jgi:hypothetical protein
VQTPSHGERKDAVARRGLSAGAVLVAVGLGCAGTAHPDLGAVLLLSGWIVIGAGVHAFGRAGSVSRHEDTGG